MDKKKKPEKCLFCNSWIQPGKSCVCIQVRTFNEAKYLENLLSQLINSVPKIPILIKSDLKNSLGFFRQNLSKALVGTISSENIKVLQEQTKADKSVPTDKGEKVNGKEKEKSIPADNNN
jgi:hypothetical protein